MRHIAILFLTLFFSVTMQAAPKRSADTVAVGMQIALIENKGQWNSRVRYEAQMHDAALFIEDSSLTFALREHRPHPAPYIATPVHYHAYRMTMIGSSSIPQGETQLPSYYNYFVGDDPSRWRSHVEGYAVVRYSELYPGIDLEVYAATSGVKYNFIVHPGGDPSQIKIRYDGTDAVKVDRKGNLHISTTVRDVVEFAPYSYQTIMGDVESTVETHWRTKRVGEYYEATFDISDYDHSRDLVIDPMLIFSTYTGSTADNWGTTATYDSQKNTYTAGIVFNIGYPTSLGAYDDSYNGGNDVGIFKFDTSGSIRLWATYLGGSSADMPHSMFVNPMDELLIFGTTGSTDFPTSTGAYQTTHAGGTPIDYESSTIHFNAGSDIFVSRFSADGSQLQASTYVGGTGNDGLNFRQYYNSNYNTLMDGNDSLYYNYGDGARGEIITDNLGNVYVGSTSMSNDFPTTTGCVQPNHSAKQDGIVFKLDYNLRNMLWSTYLGGTDDDAVYSIDVDSNYNLIACGGTVSNNFPVTDSTYQTEYGGGSADGFVSKISADGHNLMASTYFGDRFYDQIYFIRTGSHDEIFLFGQTAASGSTMIYNAGYSVYGAGMLLARMKPDMSGLEWSTVFGTYGRINLSPTAFAADICNRVYAAGWGRDFVGYNGVSWHTAGTTGMETSVDAYQDSTDGQDFYIISLDADANNMEYATFFGELHQGPNNYGGGDHVDGGTSRFDRLATLYQSVCASCSGTQAFPVSANAWSDSNRSVNCNNAIFRFNVADDFPVAEFKAPPVGCAPYTLQFENIGRGTSFQWDFGDGATSTLKNPQHTYTAAGTYTITLIANQPGGCADADTQRHTLLVLDGSHLSHTPEIACNGSLQIGQPPAFGATYQWTGDPVSDATVANPWVSQTGTYVLHTTAEGCSQVDTFHVKTYILVDNWAPSANSCHDSVDGSASFRIGPDIVPDSLTITLTPTAVIHPTTNSGGRWWFRVDSLRPNVTYHLTVSGYGCTYEQDFSIPNTPIPVYEKQANTILCNDSCSGWIKLTYDLSSIPEIHSRDTLIPNLCEGTYITNLTSLGCPVSDTTVIIRSHDLDGLHAWADRNEIYLGENVQLHASQDNTQLPIVTYTWSPINELDRPLSQDPIATPTDTLSCYTVTAQAAQCTDTAKVCIRCIEVVCGAPQFVVPNAFTPNGDGYNDRLCFNTEEIVEFSIAIFNRWGEKVYESSDPNECWDGTYRGHNCLAGVYTYTCHIRCFADKENDFKGDITIIR